MSCTVHLTPALLKFLQQIFFEAKCYFVKTGHHLFLSFFFFKSFKKQQEHSAREQPADTIRCNCTVGETFEDPVCLETAAELTGPCSLVNSNKEGDHV